MSNPFPVQTPPTGATGTVYRVRLTKVSSFVVVTQRRSATYSGTLEQLEGFARAARNHTLLLGWWGVPFGVIWTPMVLAQNARAMRKLRELAAQG